LNHLSDALEEVYSAFETASQGLNFSVYRRETVNETKPYWNFQNNARIPPIILVADLGYAFDDFIGPHGKMKYFDNKFNVTRKSSALFNWIQLCYHHSLSFNTIYLFF